MRHWHILVHSGDPQRPSWDLVTAKEPAARWAAAAFKLSPACSALLVKVLSCWSRTCPWHKERRLQSPG